MSNRIEEARKIAAVLPLIERGARTPVVQMFTELKPPVLRDLFKEIHGSPPKSGLLPFASDCILKTRRRLVEASIFMNIYVREGRVRDVPVHREVRQDCMVAAYDLYLKLREDTGYNDQSALDLTMCFVLCRDYRRRLLEVRPCRRCGADYVVADGQELLPNCPLCGAQNDSAAATVQAAPKVPRVTSLLVRNTHRPGRTVALPARAATG